MGKSKPRAKKSKRGVDFKKIKRKVGRKLPPPKNFTDTSIKSKAIILPEQSIATEKVGLAVDRKGLTLRELFQQTSHHNARTRKAALLGIKDLMLKHPLELKLHKFAIVEKLRERICDNDKVVRETLYQILKCVVFPCLMEELTRPIMSLLLAYVFNAMTHMAADIRLMAFKFFELIVLNYPSSFTLHTQQVFDNYIDILRNYQIYLQDRSNLKNALAGLERCLSFLVGKARECDRRSVLDFDERRCLHSYTSEAQNDFADIFLAVNKFEDLVPALVNCFQESILLFRGMSKNDALSFDCLLCTVGCINHSVELFVATTNKFLGCHGHVSQTDGEPDVVKIDMLGLLKKLWESFPISQPHNVGEKEDERYFILNVKITETFLHLFQWIDDNTFPIEKFLRFIECFLLGKVDCGALNKSLLEKNLSTVLPFFPRFISQSIRSWRVPLLKAFTLAFMDCKVDSPACLLYLNAIEEMILPTSSCSMLLCSDPEVLCFLVDWIHKLPKILQSVGDRHTNISEAVLKLILSIGQSSMLNSLLALEFDHIQLLLKEFYVIRRVEDAITYGPFLKLPLDCQELAICCLYYFSSLSIDLLESLCSCCLNPSMDVFIVIRVVEVLFSAYKVGHVYISDLFGFLFTLLARFKVHTKWFDAESKDGDFSSRGNFKLLATYVCLCLSRMGDNVLVLKLLWKGIINELQNSSLENAHGLLEMIVMLDKSPSQLPEENIVTLSEWLVDYLIDAASYLTAVIDVDAHCDQSRIFKYYVQPCMLLFFRNNNLLFHVLELFASALKEDNFSVHSRTDVNYSLDISVKVRAVSSILILIHNEEAIRNTLSPSKDVIMEIVQNIGNLQDSAVSNLTLEEKSNLQTIHDKLEKIFNYAAFR